MTSASPPRVSWRRLAGWSTVLLSGLVVGGPGAARHAVAAPGPATAPAAPQGDSPEGERTFKDVITDINSNLRQVGQALPNQEMLFDAEQRKKVKPTLLPLLKKVSDLCDEGMALQPLAQEQLAKSKLEITAMRAILDDPEGSTLLRKSAVSTDPEEATSATAWEILAQFAHAGKDAEGQKKAIETLDKLATNVPENDMIAQAAFLMTHAAATPALADQATQIVTGVLKGPLAERMATKLTAERKLRDLLNKPLTVTGTTVDGKPFSTAGWKGKVVVVDFWATWCTPCLMELPHLKKVYDANRPKGLELVSVSSDTDRADLVHFLAANEEMNWPQLFDDKAAGASKLHPLADQYGIQEMPAVLLIDRKGVLRAAPKNQKEMDDMVAKLVEEKQ